ncbi:UNVERIFIED_CONTAM: hypothetical protein PYX00_009913 [Menopon gallinae]|uniref:Fibronectin type-III domain-containing protein n=1 Tax=Menopon gallinae TaxID=328185 RepID=A0AAW2HDT2_9NEOP
MTMHLIIEKSGHAMACSPAAEIGNYHVPGPPGRPLIMGFTSRSANLSWAPPQNTHNSPVKFYSIHVR